MKTNKTNLKSRIFAVMVSVMLLATCFMSTTAFANTDDDAIATFHKVLTVEDGVKVPPATFNFTITNGDANYTDGNTIDAGFKANDVVVNPVSFGPTDTVVDGEVKKELKVDFTKVNWEAPGVYHYVLTETDGNQDGIKYDTKNYDLYVTVEYAENGTDLEVKSYKMIDPDKETAKDDGNINNAYETANLTLKKEVTGNQGDKNKEFTFTVNITNAVPGTVYAVDLTNAKDAGNTELTVGTEGTVTATYKLSNGENVVIKGLTENTKYTITETDYSDVGYTTTYKVGTGKATEGKVYTAENMGKDDTSVTFINNKQGNVPTGILLETAPYMILGAVVLAGIVVLFVTRRRRSH